MDFETKELESVTFTEQTNTGIDVPMIDEGWHIGHFVGWDVKKDVPVPERWQTENKKTVDKIVLWFEIYGSRVPRTVTYTWGPRSNAKKLIAGMLGKSVDERFNLDLKEILGTKCEVFVGHNVVDDYTYVNIERARPIKTKEAVKSKGKL